MSDVNQNSGGAPTGQPSLNVVAQYLKDLSFENPGAPKTLRALERPPSVNVNINVQANPLTQGEFEVEIHLEAKVATDAETLFAIELVYAGIFRIANVPQEQIHPVVMIECPRILFPFARHIVADASREGGFPPLLVDPVDFVQLYQQRMAAQQQAAATSTPQ